MSSHLMLKSLKILIVFLLLYSAVAVQAKELTILTDNWPPYNFKKDNRIVGISTELIEAALQKSKVKYKIKLYPFKRALITVKNTPNTMLFTVARIPQREEYFAWIGPIYPREVNLYRLKNRTDIKIESVADIRRYRTGVLSGGSVELFFIEHSFHAEDYSLVIKSDQLLKMLFKKRVDLIPGDPNDLAYQMKELGYKYSEIEIAYPLSTEGAYYMVANKKTSHKLIKRIQECLDEIIETGSRDKIINKYLN
ncbi:substrate-binding periplasmic protein [Maridesulfovibrio sp.]|uniref:substrate-binding periplasmic protein n=1 Tax=Maridesulfovibrio sp. TaxID=2795000 RepID=UPI0039F05F8C